MVFSAADVLQAFEASFGVRLQARRRESLRFKLLRRRLGLPRVEIFESTPYNDGLFGGRVVVSVKQAGSRDRGVRDRGLELGEAERGPRAGTPEIVGIAERANVEVLWIRYGSDIDDGALAQWTRVIAFLDRL